MLARPFTSKTKPMVDSLQDSIIALLSVVYEAFNSSSCYITTQVLYLCGKGEDETKWPSRYESLCGIPCIHPTSAQQEPSSISYDISLYKITHYINVGLVIQYSFSREEGYSHNHCPTYTRGHLKVSSYIQAVITYQYQLAVRKMPGAPGDQDTVIQSNNHTNFNQLKQLCNGIDDNLISSAKLHHLYMP